MFEGTAHIYDAVFDLVGKDYRSESEVIEQLVRARMPEARTLLDVACGTGGHLVHVRERFDVAGVDLDEQMVAVARRRLGDVDLAVGDMRDCLEGEVVASPMRDRDRYIGTKVSGPAARRADRPR